MIHKPEKGELAVVVDGTGETMRYLWNWLTGTRTVWVEAKVIDRIEIVKRTLHIDPFDGIYIWWYEEIKGRLIRLKADGSGKDIDTHPYVQVLRWVTAGHRPLRPKYQVALTMGEVSRPWKGDK